MIDVRLKDGSVLQVEAGSTVADVAKQISMGLYRNAVGGLVDGAVADLRQPLEHDCALEVLTFADEDVYKRQAPNGSARCPANSSCHICGRVNCSA